MGGIRGQGSGVGEGRAQWNCTGRAAVATNPTASWPRSTVGDRRWYAFAAEPQPSRVPRDPGSLEPTPSTWTAPEPRETRMWSKCMRLVKIRMSIREFHQLPRHPAYKYEYIDGETWLTPRPKTYHALLDLHAADDAGRRRRRDDAAAGGGRLGRPSRTSSPPPSATGRRSSALPTASAAPPPAPSSTAAAPAATGRSSNKPVFSPRWTLLRVRSGAYWSRCCRRPTSTTGGPSSGASRRRPTPWPDAWAGRT